MNRKIRRTVQLQDDIIDIYRFIHDRSPQAAEKVFDAIEKSIRSLLDTPGIGRRWISQDPRLDGIRITTVRPYRNYLIFFRATPNGIEVFRILHGSRDIQPLLDEIEIDFDEE